MTSFRPSRRALLAMAAGTAAAACVPFEKTSPFWGTISAGVGGGEKNKISRDYADKLPYASMLAWFDGGAQALVVLSEVLPDGRLTWHSAERQSITTLGPYVVAAIGFELELRNTRFPVPWARNPLEMAGRKMARTLDVVAESGRVEVPLISRFEKRDRERIEILGRSYDLQQVVERVSSDGRSRYTNRYWVDAATGRTWKSRQIVVPTLPPLNTEILKYPAAA